MSSSFSCVFRVACGCGEVRAKVSKGATRKKEASPAPAWSGQVAATADLGPRRDLVEGKRWDTKELAFIAHPLGGVASMFCRQRLPACGFPLPFRSCDLFWFVRTFSRMGSVSHVSMGSRMEP
jgi:hypothetical protein